MSMSQPYTGEIFLFAGTFAPQSFAMCDGQLVPISQNEALFFLIGTTYGGDGESNFALPDLRGRVPVHQGTGADGRTYVIGQTGGVENVTLLTQQMPSHSHAANAGLIGNQVSPGSAFWSTDPLGNTAAYSTQLASTAMAADAIDPIGGNQPHPNRQPYLGLNYVIALYGIFPTQS
jgi:microcystin-dependent protein